MKSSILKLLHDRGDYVSSQEICEQFGVSRTAVWKVINQLKEEGYEIESVTRKGYRLAKAPDLMTADEIKASLRKLKNVAVSEGRGSENDFCSDIFYYDTIDSTNTRAMQLSEQGYGTGTLVVSEEQVAGKGRRGRSWSSLPGTGIYMTILLKPDFAPNKASMLTLIAALATSRAIEASLQDSKQESVNVKPLIKWPNDIVMNGHKVCGILTEMSAQMDYINHIVIGIGINVSHTQFPEEIQATAGSILTETGVSVKRADLIARFLYFFEQYYETFLKTEDLSGVLDEYNALLVNMDREVKVLDPKNAFCGVAKGIDKTGELLVSTEQEVVRVASGEVSVRGIYGYV